MGNIWNALDALFEKEKYKFFAKMLTPHKINKTFTAKPNYFTI